MKVFRVDQDREYQVYETPDRNLVNPSMHFGQVRQTMNYEVDMMRVKSQPQYNHLSTSGKIELSTRLKALAKQQWNEEGQRMLDTPLPPNILLLLQERKKKAQQKLLKGLIFHTDLFMAIPLHAWHLFKMPYSKFTVDYLPKEFDDKKFPDMLHMKEEGQEFTIVGSTDMTNGELKAAMEKRNRVISEFVGDEEYWHCFFRTMSGIRGKEEPHIGHAHLHYISSAWGIKRQDVIDNLSSYRYNLRAETIEFEPTEWLDNVITPPQS